jgi:hypothetical protein
MLIGISLGIFVLPLAGQMIAADHGQARLKNQIWSRVRTSRAAA